MEDRKAAHPGRLAATELDFDGGNTWETAAPFYEVPAWWRRFIFIVLTPREYTVYCYIVSYCGAAQIARPLIRHMQADLNIANTAMIYSALRKLVALGFLLKEQKTLLTKQRNIYKRPALEHTLIVLLEKKLIDGKLVAKNRKQSAIKNEPKKSMDAASPGLKRLLGADLHAQWARVSDRSKGPTLHRILDQRLKEKRSEYLASQTERAAQEAVKVARQPPRPIPASTEDDVTDADPNEIPF